jgi:hypothetical protein
MQKLNFYAVQPLGALGDPILKGSPKHLAVQFPVALADYLKLREVKGFDAQLGMDSRRKPAAIRMVPSPEGSFRVVKVGRSYQVRIPELRPKDEALNSPAKYVLEADGSLTLELPPLFELADGRAIGAEPVDHTPQPRAA